MYCSTKIVDYCTRMSYFVLSSNAIQRVFCRSALSSVPWPRLGDTVNPRLPLALATVSLH